MPLDAEGRHHHFADLPGVFFQNHIDHRAAIDGHFQRRVTEVIEPQHIGLPVGQFKRVPAFDIGAGGKSGVFYRNRDARKRRPVAIGDGPAHGILGRQRRAPEQE